MKTIWFTRLLLAAALACNGAARAATLTPAEIAEQATPSVVLIKTNEGLGTGFVVSDDGRIITNVHVIKTATQATVVAADGQEFKDIELLAIDDEHDVAVLRIGAHGLKALALGDSSSAKPGQHVVAIGHPLGLGNTVSDGLISAVRDLKPKLNVLQISAPISPGSSGGPVFNDHGEVIGISTLVLSGGQNLNFAVPINIAKPLLSVEKGAPLVSAKTADKPQRKIPVYTQALLDNCSPPQLQTIVDDIGQAIKLGYPLYNAGNTEACYRIYASAALEIDRKIEACPGPRRALLDGLDQAGKLKPWPDKAWAMRDAFDAILAVTNAQNSASHPTALDAKAALIDCDEQGIEEIRDGIASAISSGAPLYDNGNAEACYRIYEGAIRDIDRSTKACPAAKQALQAGLLAAEQSKTWQQKSWALRNVFDGLTDVIDQRIADEK